MFHSEKKKIKKISINFFFTSLQSVLQNKHSDLGVLPSVVAELLWLLFSSLKILCAKYREWICIQKLTTTMLRLMFFYVVTNPRARGSPRSTLQGGSRKDPDLADHLPMVEASVAAHFQRCFPKGGLCYPWHKHTMTCQ